MSSSKEVSPRAEILELKMKVERKKNDISDGIQKFEEGRKARSDKRKEILLNIIKTALAALHEMDKKVLTEFKVGVFDCLRSLDKIDQELSSTLDGIKASEESKETDLATSISSEIELNKFILTIKKKIAELDLADFGSHLDICVSPSPGFLNLAVDKLKEGLPLESPVLAAKYFTLQFPERIPGCPTNSSSSQYELLITSSTGRRMGPTVLGQLVLQVVGLMPGTQDKVEETSVLARLEHGKATLDDFATSVTVRMRRPNNLVAAISVKVMGTNIVGSPVVHQFSHNEELDPGQHNLTLANETLATLNLDISDLEQPRTTSLDLANRQLLLSNPPVPFSPAFPRVSRVSGLTTVEEGVHNPLYLEDVLPSKYLTPALDEAREEEAEGQDVEDAENDPHILLNASKAPTSNSMIDDWGEVEWADWDDKSPSETLANTSILPTSCWRWRWSADHSVWETTVVETDNVFNLLKSDLQLTEVHEPQALTKTQGDRYCLTAPCDVAYLPQVNRFLVTEPPNNRIGIYREERFRFEGWLENPAGGYQFNYPTSIICLSNQFVVITLRENLLVLNNGIKEVQEICGKFHGFAEGQAGELFTLMENKKKETTVRKFLLNETSRKYEKSEDILVSVIQDFDHWSTSSKCRYLAVSEDKLFISDMGLHKVYVVDLVSNNQTAFGYLGSQEGQLRGPSGLLVDKVGNLLVADSENDRLVLYSQEGRFLRTLFSKDKRLSAPQGLVRYERSLLTAFMGREGEGAVARYQQKQNTVENEELDSPNRPLE